MTISLGIDTGGTYTDAVLLDQETGNVLASAKALTTLHDLSLGIEQAITAALRAGHKSNQALTGSDITMVGLSTTLATNAITEGYGARVCLLLIGYNQDLMIKQGFERQLPAEEIVYLEGGHDLQGNETTPLNIDAARQAIATRSNDVEAFAISGYFATRNSSHEIRLRTLVQSMTSLPVTCGSELTTRLNAVRRAVTVALNARLIPLIHELISKVRETLTRLGVTAPLMVVKGDGSLVKAEWAQSQPIETILSGPAASAVGGLHLAAKGDAWIVDMGGTTTDIVGLHDGQPRINPEGAFVGCRRTLIEAADVHTVGLGGDSHVTINSKGKLVVGPRRVIPLCMLAAKFPSVEEKLNHQVLSKVKEHGAGQFAIPGRKPPHSLPKEDMDLLRRMEKRPLTLCDGGGRENWLLYLRIEQLEKKCLVQRAGFTPTDALHVLGHMTQWNNNASRLGAELLAHRLQSDPKSIASKVVQIISDGIAREVVTKILADQSDLPHWEKEPTATWLLQRAFGYHADSELACTLSLSRSLVALGAPVKAYLPAVANRLHAELIIPKHSEVANAVGAVTGSVVQRVKVLITPLQGGSRFRVHGPNGIADFESLEQAIYHTQRTVPPYLEALAKKAGAGHVEITISRIDRGVKAHLAWLQQIHLDTELTFTAIGRPVRKAQL